MTSAYQILNMKLMNVIVMIAGVLGGGTHTMKLFLFWGGTEFYAHFLESLWPWRVPKIKVKKKILNNMSGKKNWVCTIEAWPPP